MIATGHSQSATRLRTYYNSILPLSNILDAVVLHGGGGAMRSDIPRPVFRINSEGDIAGGIGNGARQADSPTFRTVGGLGRLARRLEADHRLRPAAQARHRHLPRRLSRASRRPARCRRSRAIPQHMVQGALYDQTVDWVAYGIAPPTAPVHHHDDAHGHHRRA